MKIDLIRKNKTDLVGSEASIPSVDSKPSYPGAYLSDIDGLKDHKVGDEVTIKAKIKSKTERQGEGGNSVCVDLDLIELEDGKKETSLAEKPRKKKPEEELEDALSDEESEDDDDKE